MMTELRYNVRRTDGGGYQPYLPAHPYIGCPVYKTRHGAVEYIANTYGLTIQEYLRLSGEGRVRLCTR